MKIKWLFFDIGSTIVDETEAYNHRIREMIAGTNITFEEFDEKRRYFTNKGLDGNSEAIKEFNLKKTPWHSEDESLYKETLEVLKYLKNKGYQLGVIANQSKGLSERLESFGILMYFDIVLASAEIGIAKPDKLIFHKALELSQTEACECVMIGDRLDNDIIPAKTIGFQTVWIRNDLTINHKEELGKGIADWVIDNLKDLESIF